MLFRAALTVVAGGGLEGGGDTYVYFSLHSPTEQSGGKILISYNFIRESRVYSRNEHPAWTRLRSLVCTALGRLGAGSISTDISKQKIIITDCHCYC